MAGVGCVFLRQRGPLPLSSQSVKIDNARPTPTTADCTAFLTYCMLGLSRGSGSQLRGGKKVHQRERCTDHNWVSDPMRIGDDTDATRRWTQRLQMDRAPVLILTARTVKGCCVMEVETAQRGAGISGSHHFMNVFPKVEFQNNTE